MTTRARAERSIWPARRTADDPLAFLGGLAACGAEVVPFELGRRAAFLLNHPARVEDVLVRQADAFVKGRGYERATGLLGTGLLTAAGPLHRERRRLVQGALHAQRVAALAPLIVSHAARRRETWQAGTAVEVDREMRQLTLAIAGDALLGVDLSPWMDEVVQAVDAAVSPFDGLLAIVAPPARVRKSRQRLDAVIDAILAARREAVAPHQSLLDVLLEDHVQGDTTSERQMRDDVLTFLLAGHDTISLALTWTWLQLSDHPEVDQRLGAEIAEVLGERVPEASDLNRLVFARAVLAEALRLFPPAWVIVRRAVRACRVGQVEVPRGALVVASPYITQRDPRFFHDPLTFRPERWLPTPAEEFCSVDRVRPKLAYFPFGVGLRACVGEGLAWFEGTLVMATLAQRFRLQRLPSTRVAMQPRITLRPSGGLRMAPVLR